MADYEAYGRTVEVGLILVIAEALRDEFGVTIDAHPGGTGNEAGVVNRAFRASAHRILKSVVTPIENLDGVLTWVLRWAASMRLTEVGVVEKRAENLLGLEQELGDAWLAYLALAPDGVIEGLLGEGQVAG